MIDNPVMVVLHPSTLMVAMVDSDTMVVAAEAADGNNSNHKEVVEVADRYLMDCPQAPYPVPVSVACMDPRPVILVLNLFLLFLVNDF